MAAQLKSLAEIATEIEAAQFQVTLNRTDRGQDEYLTGIVRGMALAHHRARLMAESGWKAVVEPIERHGLGVVRVTYEPLL